MQRSNTSIWRYHCLGEVAFLSEDLKSMMKSDGTSQLFVHLPCPSFNLVYRSLESTLVGQVYLKMECSWQQHNCYQHFALLRDIRQYMLRYLALFRQWSDWPSDHNHLFRRDWTNRTNAWFVPVWITRVRRIISWGNTRDDSWTWQPNDIPTFGLDEGR